MIKLYFTETNLFTDEPDWTMYDAALKNLDICAFDINKFLQRSTD